ncbi:uncharacterized protein LOC131890945 isoform X2 [Tigriopus californicus]|uniref:uncharacterized protein LOC131890945 isoform X2 n=1 Tax=Tigriopus californicus TaxID=6832 RepID=UPI0027DAB120|nr:uncharacterized protein LOC131890945 isoform X2 [Tigriopus californicus]
MDSLIRLLKARVLKRSLSWNFLIQKETMSLRFHFTCQEEVEKRVRKVPRPNTIMRTFLHVTTALYSMAGLGSLKQSRFYRDEINKSQDNQVNSNQEGDMAGPLGDPNDVFSEDKIDHEDVSARSNGPLEKLEAEHSKEIDIYLEETDTIWMLNIPGTCVEVDPDAPDKDEADGDNPNPQDEEGRVVFKYQLVDRWSQTLDFSKKRKGTQCDEIEVEPQATQVSTKDFLEEKRKLQNLGPSNMTLRSRSTSRERP